MLVDDTVELRVTLLDAVTLADTVTVAVNVALIVTVSVAVDDSLMLSDADGDRVTLTVRVWEEDRVCV